MCTGKDAFTYKHLDATVPIKMRLNQYRHVHVNYILCTCKLHSSRTQLHPEMLMKSILPWTQIIVKLGYKGVHSHFFFHF